jgi:Domain of unknown function (DUF6916)
VLEHLTVETFAPAVGDTFVLDAGDAGRLDLELLDARALERDDPPGSGESGRRTPFTVVFRGPAEPLLPQRIYRLEHATLGPLEIFIVPVARDEAGAVYEAIFG